ncbi:MAG TPA: diguanylate cyclase [Xanthomonadaceae bacterium]|nr:diguanylate cyclase [Xanthomonadaceae bacterium]
MSAQTHMADTTHKPSPAPRHLRVLAVHLSVLGLWMAGFLAARLVEYAPHASLWFPPAAVTFAALLVLGARALPTLWLACVLATVLTDIAYANDLPAKALLASNVAFAFAHTLAYGLVAWPLRRLAGTRATPRRSLRALVAFLLGGAVAAGLAALLGAGGLRLSGMIPAGDVAAILVPWWIGDYAGLVALAPLVALVIARLSDWAGLAGSADLAGFMATRTRSDRRLPFLLKLALLLGFSVLVLVVAASAPEQEALVFALFVSVIVQLWIVHTEGETQALLAIAAFSLLVAVATATLQLGAQALTLQFALICLAANSHFGLVVPRLFADNQRLRHLLTHDALTDTLSRAFFEDRAREGMAACRHRHEPAALLMIDLDRLKAINDELGHAAGDRALRAAAQACLGCLRPGDALGRLSGDEFGAFLPGCDAAAAGRLVDDMRRALARASSDLGLPLQASFGVGLVDGGSEGYESVLANADQAMYKDKRRQAGENG